MQGFFSGAAQTRSAWQTTVNDTIYLTHSGLLETLIQHRPLQTYNPFQCTEKTTTTVADVILLQMSEHTQLKSFTRAMHRIFRGQRTSSRTWTPSARSLSLEVASGQRQEQLHCWSLTLTPCQSLWRGRRGHDVRAFGRRMREELPLQTISIASR